MTLKQYIFTMLFGTILCWVAWFFVLTNVDPFQSLAAGFIFFYLSLFLALVGTISIIAFLVYRFVGTKEVPMFKHVQISFRHAVLFSVFISLFLFLQGKQFLNFWNTLVLLTLFGLVFSFSLSVKKKV